MGKAVVVEGGNGNGNSVWGNKFEATNVLS